VNGPRASTCCAFSVLPSDTITFPVDDHPCRPDVERPGVEVKSNGAPRRRARRTRTGRAALGGRTWCGTTGSFSQRPVCRSPVRASRVTVVGLL
jgi:hypothetical protein